MDYLVVLCFLLLMVIIVMINSILIGWNGNDNEWYEIGDLTPGPFNFNLKHRAF